ncbi:MAG: hypothetical protein V3U98_09010 [Acidobacteriota bacterium]
MEAARLRFALFLCTCLTMAGALRTAPASQTQPSLSAPQAARAAEPPETTPERPGTLVDVLKALRSGAASSFDDLPFQSLLEYHKAVGGQTYASISIGYNPGALRARAGTEAKPQPFAALYGLAEGALNYTFTETIDFADSGVSNASGLHVHQTGHALAPGRYRLVTGVWISEDALAGVRTEIVDIPAFTAPELTLSSVTLASALGSAPGADPTLKQPFIWGNFKVVPRIEPTITRQEPLQLYYQIYNAAHDPQSGKPRLDITYTFFQRKLGRFQQAAQQPFRGQTSEVALYELPLNAWPPGEFKLRIEVRDAIADTSVSRELRFDLR